ncbi:MAG TPA: hypothetical protein VJA45_04975 [Methylomirabilota bacterium]|jgi:cytochrome b561|nr:hypothetical protein [Methylomirabilota bacterium]
MKAIISRYLAIIWLMAALSLAGWLLVNLDTAGWILLVITVGLMAWELTFGRSARGGGAHDAKPADVPDQPHPSTRRDAS